MRGLRPYVFAQGVHMPKSFILRPLLSAVAPTLLLSGVASAEMIAPGGMTEDLATSLSARPDLGGEFEATIPVPFMLMDDQHKVFYTGQIDHSVLRDPDTSALSFSYRFVNAPTSAILGIENFIASDFGKYTTDVAVLTDNTGETAPTDALRTGDGAQV